jgi:hypothetical protein
VGWSSGETKLRGFVKSLLNERFEVFTAVTTKNTVFWNVTPWLLKVATFRINVSHPSSGWKVEPDGATSQNTALYKTPTPLSIRCHDFHVTSGGERTRVSPVRKHLTTCPHNRVFQKRLAVSERITEHKITVWAKYLQPPSCWFLH